MDLGHILNYGAGCDENDQNSLSKNFKSGFIEVNMQFQWQHRFTVCEGTFSPCQRQLKRFLVYATRRKRDFGDKFPITIILKTHNKENLCKSEDCMGNGSASKVTTPSIVTFDLKQSRSTSASEDYQHHQ